MCQYDSRCPVGTHRPGTRCRYTRNRALSTLGSLAIIAFVVTVALPRIDLPLLETIRDAATDDPEGQPATVTRVIDGDTITAKDEHGNDLGRIRILGLDAPELDHDECWATEARDAATDLLDGQHVTLTPDPKNDDHDTYDRLLRYVDLDGTDASEELIQDGHAPDTTNPRQHTRHHDYRAAEQHAQDEHRGLWSHCP